MTRQTKLHQPALPLFPAPLKPVHANVRIGRVPAFMTQHDLDNMLAPRGEAAQDAFDSSMGAFDGDWYDGDMW